MNTPQPNPTQPTASQIEALTKAIEQLTQAIVSVRPWLADLADSALSGKG